MDGHDLRTIDALSLRQKIGVVQQDTAIFGGTILENIAFGQEDIAFGEVEAVLDQGVIVESGTHEELLQAKGLYYYLVSQQL